MTKINERTIKLTTIGDNRMSTTEYCKLVDENICPDCGAELIPQGGCKTCRNCGFDEC